MTEQSKHRGLTCEEIEQAWSDCAEKFRDDLKAERARAEKAEQENARLAAALERARGIIDRLHPEYLTVGFPDDTVHFRMPTSCFRDLKAAISDPSACLEAVKREARAEAWMEAAEICRRQSFVYLGQTESMGEPEFSQLGFASSACFYLEKKMKSKATLDGREENRNGK